jgi:hypothetical protein
MDPQTPPRIRAFSEGHAIPRTASNLRPLLNEVPSLTELTIRTPKTPSPERRVPLELEIPVRRQPSTPRSGWQVICFPSGWQHLQCCLPHSLRFNLHLLLVALFETLFFWLYVSQSEDAALVGLVNTYTSGVFASCANMTPTALNLTNSVFNALVDQKAVDRAGALAAADRAAYNNDLLSKTWLYVGGLGILFVLQAAVTCIWRIAVPWGHLVGENVALVALLGLYEWMFFHTVVFRYHSITPAELDRMVIDEFSANC